jgi:hypothetical protein
MKSFRVARAPAPRSSVAWPLNRVESVILAPGEDVQWSWTHGPDGSYVSGYTIRTRTKPSGGGRPWPKSD